MRRMFLILVAAAIGTGISEARAGCFTGGQPGFVRQFAVQRHVPQVFAQPFAVQQHAPQVFVQPFVARGGCGQAVVFPQVVRGRTVRVAPFAVPQRFRFRLPFVRIGF